MKLTTTTTELLKLLSKVLPAVPSKSTLQILKNVKVEVTTSSLTLSTCNLELYINATTVIESTGEFGFCIEARKLHNIISNLPKGAPLELEYNDYLVTIKSSGLSVDICVFDIMEFPGAPDIEPTDRMTINSEDLKALSVVSYAVSNDPTRLSLNGVYVHSDIDDEVIFAATCGHRLMQYKHKLPKIKEGYIVPAPALNAINKVALKEDVRIKFSDTYIKFDIDEVSIIHKLIEGPFPNYQNVIPSSFLHEAEINRLELLESLKEISSCTPSNNSCVRLEFKDDNLNISSRDQGFGLSAKKNLEVGYAGEVFAIGFNCKYLMDMLGKLDCKMVSFGMNSPVGGCVIEPVGSVEYRPTLLLMPLRLVD